jgi:hypothetical protein
MPTRISLFGPRVTAANTFNVGTSVSFTLSSETGRGGYSFIFARTALASFNAILNVNSSTSPQPVAQSLPLGTTGLVYSVTISASGGTSPYTFALVSGSLPPGLSLNGTTGVISGTPTTVGGYTFTIAVTDFNGSVGNQSFAITIIAPAASGGGAFTFLN